MNCPKAVYCTVDLPTHYLGNPLIECLPSILNPTDSILTLMGKPDLDLTMSRQQPYHLRLHYVDQLEGIYIPRPEMLAFDSEVAIMLRRGLMRRHPFLPETQRYLYELRDNLQAHRVYDNPLASSYFIIAISGSGKTRGIGRSLRRYPSCIQHHSYNGRPFLQKQIMYISVDAPLSGSIQGLLLRLWQEIDNALGLKGKYSYFKQFARSRMPYDKQIELFCQAAASHYVGLIHIDDLQRVWESNRAQRDLIYGFIIQLSNTAKIPLILSGTPKASSLMANSLEAARRTITAGYIELEPPSSQDDQFFTTLLKALFKYQWTNVPLALTPEIRKIIWEWTQGIPAITITLYIQAQKIALRAKSDRFEIAHLRAAYDGPLKILHPALSALRKRDAHALRRYEDLFPTSFQMKKALMEQSGERLTNEDIMQIALGQF